MSVITVVANLAILLPNLSTEVIAKYDLVNNTLVSKDAEFRLEIGDSKSADFLPQVKLCRWDNECNFSAQLIVDPAITAIPVCSFDKEKLVYSLGSDLATHFFDRDEKTFAFDVILLKPPKSNVVEWTIQHKGLNFYYQHLLEDDFASGNLPDFKRVASVNETDIFDHDGQAIGHRPLNISGSYAVYHSEKTGDYTGRGGKNYQHGKAFHIYRPRIIDSDGTEVWGQLKIDTGTGIMSVTIPQEFLDKAVYPVTVDPDLGKTTTTGTAYNMQGTAYVTHGTTDVTGGNFSEIHAYCFDGSDSVKFLRCAVYGDDGGADPSAPSARLLLYIDIIATGNAAWFSGAYVETASASTKYWVAMTMTASGLRSVYDDGGANSIVYSAAPIYDLPNPYYASHVHATYRFAVHAVYAPTSGAELLPLLRIQENALLRM